MFSVQFFARTCEFLFHSFKKNQIGSYLLIMMLTFNKVTILDEIMNKEIIELNAS